MIKTYIKGVVGGFIVFICSFIFPKDTLELFDYHEKWQNKLIEDKIEARN